MLNMKWMKEKKRRLRKDKDKHKEVLAAHPSQMGFLRPHAPLTTEPPCPCLDVQGQGTVKSWKTQLKDLELRLTVQLTGSPPPGSS